MYTIGDTIETKKIGLSIGTSGTYNNTEVVNEKLQLKKDGDYYFERGSWTSDVINLGDRFREFEKVFATEIINGDSSYAVSTRVSDNRQVWSDWTPVAINGTIQSEMAQYVQVKIDLFAGYENNEIKLLKLELKENDFIEQSEELRLKHSHNSDAVIDTTWTDEGSLHRKQFTRDEWLRIDKAQPFGGSTRLKVKDVSCGQYHSSFVSENGDLYTWGLNDKGQLGDGTLVEKLVPTRVGHNLKWKKVSASRDYTLAIDKDDELYGWGGNDKGQLGNGTKVDRLFAGRITGMKWKMVSAGNTHSLGITTDGDLYAWGENGGEGKLGDGTKIEKLVPTKIGDLKWKQVSTGYNFSLGITEAGDLYAWGTGGLGSLGNGTVENKLVPTKIGNLKWKTISSYAAGFHSMAITEDGDLYAWGYNNQGQLGDGTTVNKLIPTKIGSMTKWKMISFGSNSAVAIAENDDLYAFGKNNLGQLGDGTNVDKSTFIRINTIAKWKMTSKGYYHTLGMTTDGYLYGWGHNLYGQIGDGTKTNKNILTDIAVRIQAINKTLILHDGEHKAFIGETGGTPSIPAGEVDLIPKMTGFTTGGVTVSSDTSIGDVSPVWKVFDDINNDTNNASTGWLSGVRTSAWIKVDFGKKETIGKYTVASYGVLLASNGKCMPKSWTFEGSNTGTFTGEQILLDSRTNQSDWGNLEKREYSFSNSTGYQYYRINISNNNGESRIAIGEMEMFQAGVSGTLSTSAYWSNVSNTLPTTEQFLLDGMDSLSPSLDRKVITLEPQSMTPEINILSKDSKSKVFSQDIDLKKYVDIQNMKVEVK